MLCYLRVMNIGLDHASIPSCCCRRTMVEDLFDPYLRRDPYRDLNGEPGLSSVTITPPVSNVTAPASDSPSRRRLLVCDPTTNNAETCARQTLSTLARRAYRRPVTAEDLEI